MGKDISENNVLKWDVFRENDSEKSSLGEDGPGKGGFREGCPGKDNP